MAKTQTKKRGPAPPRHLDALAKTHWHKLCGLLDAGPGLVAADLLLVELAAVSYSKWRAAYKARDDATLHRHHADYTRALVDLKLTRRGQIKARPIDSMDSAPDPAAPTLRDIGAKFRLLS